MTFILVRICKTNQRKSLSGLSEFYFSNWEVKLTWNTYSDHLKKSTMVMNEDFSVILVTEDKKQMLVQHHAHHCLPSTSD